MGKQFSIFCILGHLGSQNIDSFSFFFNHVSVIMPWTAVIFGQDCHCENLFACVNDMTKYDLGKYRDDNLVEQKNSSFLNQSCCTNFFFTLFLLQLLH